MIMASQHRLNKARLHCLTTVIHDEIRVGISAINIIVDSIFN